MTASEEFRITFVSVGDAGLTQRPAILYQGETVAVLNKDSKHGDPVKVIDAWTDGHGTWQFKLRMADGFVKVTRRR
jgi:hypothetical protein